jgi:hypothetical protein
MMVPSMKFEYSNHVVFIPTFPAFATVIPLARSRAIIISIGGNR